MANRMIPYGYGIMDGAIGVIETEAEVVKRIFDEYIDGKTLKEIAAELTYEHVEYYMGTCLWNKSRIARIIENEKYIGIDGYPQIIDEDDFVCAVNLKEKKGIKKMSFGAEIDYLRGNKVTCAQCGSSVRRYSNWHGHDRWVCRRLCANDIPVSDTVFFSGMNVILNKIFQNPDCVRPKEELRRADIDVKRCTNEVNRMFNSATPSFAAGKKLIFQLAQQKFVSLNENVPEIYTDMLIEDTVKAVLQGKVDTAYMKKHFEKISIGKAGDMTIRFVNGVEISSNDEVEVCNKEQE